MKIELIVPAVEENARVPNLALPILAGLSPKDAEISFTDDLLTPIHLDMDLKEVDLAGITVLTKTAVRAYAIADAYRKKGVPVFLGEAKEVWPRLLEDARMGTLKPFYRQEGYTELSKMPMPRRNILPKSGYLPLDVVQVSRGCPFRCEFCTVQKFFGKAHRLRPVSEVVEEVRRLPHRWMMFADDNIIGNQPYSEELLKAFVPLKKKWFGQASLSGLKKIENVEALAESGCISLFIGFESLFKTSLVRAQKFQNDPAEYREIIGSLHRIGIAICGAFIFGFDEDDPSVFEETVSFAIRTKLFSAVFVILTPYPETDFYHRIKNEGRLARDQWWLLERQGDFAPHFLPMKMSAETLREGWKKTWREFHSFPSIWKRFHWEYSPTLLNRIGYFPFQLMQHRFTKKKILGGGKKISGIRQCQMSHPPPDPPLEGGVDSHSMGRKSSRFILPLQGGWTGAG